MTLIMPWLTLASSCCCMESSPAAGIMQEVPGFPLHQLHNPAS